MVIILIYLLQKKRFAVNFSKSVRFAFNAMNAVKKLLSGEKLSFHRYQQNAAKKNLQNAVKKNLLLKLQIFTALISTPI